jgi:uncharacterized BrkB/YihY/UPF0761 family membrane protein
MRRHAARKKAHTGGMAAMWSLGGLSAAELLKRTVRESWQDDVFGQAARLAFYHFLAMFPLLLLVLIPLARLPGAGADMRELLAGSLDQFLPADAASLIAAVIQDLNSNAHEGGGVLILAAAGAIWAGFNASLAIIAGLNMSVMQCTKRTVISRVKGAATLRSRPLRIFR